MMCVYRTDQPDQVEVYRAPLREPLPNIPVPLRRGERDVVLQLQPLIDECHHEGRYDERTYQVDPIPGLSKEDAAWAEAGKKDFKTH